MLVFFICLFLFFFRGFPSTLMTQGATLPRNTPGEQGRLRGKLKDLTAHNEVSSIRAGCILSTGFRSSEARRNHTPKFLWQKYKDKLIPSSVA